MTTPGKAPCVAGCNLPGRYAVTPIGGSVEGGTVCGRHVSHVLDLMTRKGRRVIVSQVAGRNYR